MVTDKEILDRAQLLMGADNMERLASARVIIFGVGGVGSWCAECLVRSGIRHLTIVDSDRVCPSNINRQLMATVDTIGRVKVDVLKERLLAVAPDACIDARCEVFCQETAASFDLGSYDYIIDAIDSLRDKMLLIEMATSTRATFFSSMGAALKMDSTRIHVAEFWKVEGCPLARALRQRFKRLKTRPARKFMCVYSDEHLQNMGQTDEIVPGKAQVNGSLMHITAIFGLTIAGLVLRHITGIKLNKNY